jgi:acyl dehydratase
VTDWDWSAPVPFHVGGALAEAYREAVGDECSPRTVAGPDGTIAVAPPFLLALAVNRAAREIPSPPGSVHARQRFSFFAPVRIGTDLSVRVRRAGTEERRGRTHVILEYRITDPAGALVATAESRTIWASGA